VAINRDAWIKEAQECERAGAVATCTAIVRSTIEQVRYTYTATSLHPYKHIPYTPSTYTLYLHPILTPYTLIPNPFNPITLSTTHTYIHIYIYTHIHTHINI
jgi:hypothetical protein